VPVVKAYVGLRFRHKRIIDNDDPTRGAVCTVSSIRRGMIYYVVGDEKRAREYVTPERWDRVCGDLLSKL
jgi:hypothetical protein